MSAQGAMTGVCAATAAGLGVVVVRQRRVLKARSPQKIADYFEMGLRLGAESERRRVEMDIGREIERERAAKEGR